METNAANLQLLLRNTQLKLKGEPMKNKNATAHDIMQFKLPGRKRRMLQNIKFTGQRVKMGSTRK